MLGPPAIPSSSLLLLPKKRLLLSWTQAMEAILQLGIEGAPEEQCGVMVPYLANDCFDGVGWEITRLANRAENKTRGYAIDPETIAQMVDSPKSWSEVRVWHTHPRGNVGPSDGDMIYAQPGVKYVVVAVPSGEWREFSRRTL